MRISIKPLLAACALAWVGLGGVADADTPVTYTEGKTAIFSFVVPDFWALRTGGPRELEDTQLGDARAVSRVMGLRPVTDDNVWMGFVSPSSVATIEGGLRYLEDIDRFLVKDPVISTRSDTRIGGLPAHIIRGTGKREGRGISFTATVIDLPKDRVVIGVTILRDGADPAYVDDLNAVFASFRSLQ